MIEKKSRGGRKRHANQDVCKNYELFPARILRIDQTLHIDSNHHDNKQAEYDETNKRNYFFTNASAKISLPT